MFLSWPGGISRLPDFKRRIMGFEKISRGFLGQALLAHRTNMHRARVKDKEMRGEKKKKGKRGGAGGNETHAQVTTTQRKGEGWYR